jgi:hypothetical protein
MIKSRKQLSSLPLSIEVLEERRLMADTWGAFPKLMGQEAAAANYPLVTGAGTTIAVIDTGVDYLHPALGGGFGAGHKVVGGYDFVDNDGNPMDSDGHGTGVAGLGAGLPYYHNGQRYQGVAPGANVVALRTDDGTFGWAKMAPLVEKALQWVIANRDLHNVVSVNMSFGRGHYASATTLAPIDDELAQLRSMGVALFASSGNDGIQNGTPGVEYPAADPNVFGVGSINSADNISSWTERGPGLDFLAPGENVVLPYYLPATNQHIVLAAGSGTSFATPYASGLSALIRQVNPTLTVDEVYTIMADSGVAKYDAATGLTFPRLSVNGAIAQTYVASDDGYEHNDSFAQAKAMAFAANDTTALSGLKLVAGDADFFRFTLETMSDVDLAVTRAGGTGLPSVDLVNSSGVVVRHLSPTDSVRLAAGTYFLRVNAPGATMAGTYGLSVARAPDDALNNHTVGTSAAIALDATGHGAVGGMILLGGADDYFHFDLDSTHDVDLLVDEDGLSGSATVQLLDADGNLIANVEQGVLSRRLSAGRYLIRVASAATLDGTYGVSVGATPFVIPGENGSMNAVAYDAVGKMYLAYFDEYAKHLKVATRDANGVWQNAVVVDPAFMAGQFVSIALDAAGLPGLAYYDANHADLKYAKYDGSSWSVQTVDATFTTGYYPSLQFTGAGRPVISYYSKTAGDLKFAAFNGGAWELSTIDAAGDVGRYSSLALNPATGRWAVGYEDTGKGWFKYAEQTKTAWTPAVVDGTTKIGGGYVSLAFNPLSKRPAMSYYDAYNADLKYATFNGSAWGTKAIVAKGSVGLYSNLRIDATTGDADVLYYNRGADGVFRAKATGGVWALSQITNDGGRWISRATDADGGETVGYLKSMGGVAVVDV